MSEDRKRSLSQEVYSLQLVDELRTGESRNLREQLARATQQLEQVEMGRAKLRKATARMEDLEEQLKIKNEFERQLSLEKSQLEKSDTDSKKAAQRMSQNVEELQWRIKNNFELPTEFYQDKPVQGFAEPSKISAKNTQAEPSLQSSPITVPRKESTIKQRSFFDV